MEGNSGKNLEGATIDAKASKASTRTDRAGNFIISLKAGEQLISISHVGFYPKSLAITFKETFSTLEVVLLPEISQLDELTVTEKTPDENVRSSQMGVVTLDMKSLQNIPVVFGETDILKALTLQAGVCTVGEGTAGFNVRGGRTDQNLVLLNGAPLFNTSHLLGFLSNINADAVRDVTLFKGDIPASFGGRLSSLLATTTRTGNKDRIHVSAGVGLMAAGILADGPISKNKRLTFLADELLILLFL